MSQFLKCLSACVLLSLTGCVTTKPIEPLTYKTYIIWYDSEIGKNPLLQALEEKNGKILYIYNNFNSVAASIPIYKSQDDVKAYFLGVPGVLSVQEDQVYQLH